MINYLDGLINISFNSITSLFDENWDFSYLNYSEMEEVLNFPIKLAPNHLERLVQQEQDIPEDVLFLIIVKKTQDYDYSLNHIFETTCNKYIPQLKLTNFWCNYKYAAMKAGLGQLAKNSLFYHHNFQFETHLSVFIVFNHLTNLPIRNNPNYNLLDFCNGCDDCFNACPVGAIHNQGRLPWIDMNKCDNFCFFGNHTRIPSIKWNMPILQNIQKGKIHSYQDFYNLFPDGKVNSSFIDDNGEIHWYQYPTCRECTSQPKCSKYNGKYPYDWNNVKIL